MPELVEQGAAGAVMRDHVGDDAETLDAMGGAERLHHGISVDEGGRLGRDDDQRHIGLGDQGERVGVDAAAGVDDDLVVACGMRRERGEQPAALLRRQGRAAAGAAMAGREMHALGPR